MTIKTFPLMAIFALLVLSQGCIDTGVSELRKPALLKEDSNTNLPAATAPPESPAALFTPTPPPSPTQVPDTPTPVPTPTSTPPPTQTPQPTSTPTHTPLPTGTPTPTSTATSTPVVTPTVTPSVCGYAQLVLMGAGKDHEPCYTPTPTP